MTSTDQQLIREAFHVIAEGAPQAPPFAVAATLDPVGTKRTGRPGWLVGVAAAALVLVTVGALPLLINSSGGEDTAVAGSETATNASPASTVTSATSTVAVASASTGPNTVVGLGAPVRLGVLESGDAVDAAVFDNATSIATGLHGTVVAGYRSRDFVAGPAIWHSSDGAPFGLVYAGSLVGDAPDTDTPFIIDVAASDSGFVAVGRAGSRSVVWTSADGTSWTQTTAVGVDGYVSAVSAYANQWLAVGSEAVDGEDSHAVVWTSTDGVTWDSVDSAAFKVDGSRSFMFDVAVYGDLIVAVGGSDGVDERRERPEIWLSDDAGVTWSRTSIDPAVFDIPVGDGLLSVAVGPTGIVALGESRPQKGGAPDGTVVYSSTDGSTWQRTFGPLRSGFDTATTKSGFVWFYNNGAATDPKLLAVSSPDGATWEPVDRFAISGFGLAAVTSAGDSILVVGHEGTQPSSPATESVTVYQVPARPDS